MSKLWTTIVRLRTWLVNGAGFILVAILPLLGAPEVMAVVPPGYQKYVIAAAFVLNILMRPRPAAVKPKDEVHGGQPLQAALSKDWKFGQFSSVQEADNAVRAMMQEAKDRDK